MMILSSNPLHLSSIADMSRREVATFPATTPFS